MVLECNWSVRWLNKPVPYILRWFGRGCDDVYVDVALHSAADREPYSILFLKKGAPFTVPAPEHALKPASEPTLEPTLQPTPAPEPVPGPARDSIPKPDDGSQRRTMEVQDRWYLPGGICRDKDRKLFDWLWADIHAKFGRGLSIIEITALIDCAVVIVDNENGEGERKVLVLTVGARHVRDIPTTGYTMYGFSEHRWFGERFLVDEEFQMRKCAALRRHLRSHLMRLETARGSRRFPRLPMLASLTGLFPKFR
ncbi:hypothetical protein FHL15_001668 [Xylaria flabelliformis]|uniref:Uncharacterized protein n=1 Tax=Xylaria flabelliformis TaxID=2512241 RepID=A0A553IB11_9PEZI|nr:hypothetical protein FHL15_001668 [Xylaria flabelliformis]